MSSDWSHAILCLAFCAYCYWAGCIETRRRLGRQGVADLKAYGDALKAYHDSLNAGRVELLENARKLDEVVGALDELSSARVLAKLRDIRSVTIGAVPERQKEN